ncbi:MAG: hypothetical protein V3V15_04725 [Sphingorhabdus sp.]
MTAIASLLFAGLFALSIAAIMLTLSNAAARIRMIIKDVHGSSSVATDRIITISVPKIDDAKIVAMPKKMQPFIPAATGMDRIAA